MIPFDAIAVVNAMGASNKQSFDAIEKNFFIIFNLLRSIVN